MLSSSGLPLSGQSILVTRAAGQSTAFRDLLQTQGATVVEMPTLEIRPPSSWEPLDRAIAQLPHYHWLILTSANAVNYFWQRLKVVYKTNDLAAPLAGLKIAVVGKKTAAVLKQQGIEPDFIPPDFIADSLVDEFPDELAQLKVLFPRVESGGREVLVQAFRAAGAEVSEVAAYESGCPQVVNAPAIAHIRSGELSAITFASSKTVRHFVQLVRPALGEQWLSQLKDIAIASIGPQTSEECRQQFGRVDIEACEYTLEGLTEAIASHFSHSS